MRSQCQAKANPMQIPCKSHAHPNCGNANPRQSEGHFIAYQMQIWKLFGKLGVSIDRSVNIASTMGLQNVPMAPHLANMAKPLRPHFLYLAPISLNISPTFRECFSIRALPAACHVYDAACQIPRAACPVSPGRASYGNLASRLIRNCSSVTIR